MEALEQLGKEDEVASAIIWLTGSSFLSYGSIEERALPLYYLLVFLHFIIYIIVAIIVRRRASVEIYLCPRHLQRRKYFLLGVWASLALGFIALMASFALSKALLALAAGVLLIVALTLGVFFVRPLATTKIRDKTVWLGGAGKEFLASLPVRDE